MNVNAFMAIDYEQEWCVQHPDNSIKIQNDVPWFLFPVLPGWNKDLELMRQLYSCK